MADQRKHIDSTVDLDTLRAVTVTVAAERVLTAKPRRAAALTYLRQRGIDTRTLEAWPLGYAPPGWTRLVDALRPDFSDQELVAAGVATLSSRGSLIDTFRDRVIFPVRRADGQTAGFTGRDLSGNPDTPKYLNTRRTALFDKSTLLYGLPEGHPGAQPVLVEGPVDVLALAALTARSDAATLRPVAACGTALTPSHARTLAALGVGKIVVAFDADSAGHAAALRAGHTLHAAGLDARLAVLPPGLDPADYLTHPAASVETFTHAAAVPLLTAQVEQRIADQGDRMQWIEGRLAAARAIATDLTAYPTNTVATQLGWIAHALQLDAATVAREVNRAYGHSVRSRACESAPTRAMAPARAAREPTPSAAFADVGALDR